MNAFSIALALFVAIHVGIAATGLRGRLVSRIGEGPYRIAFSLISAVLLLWMISSFGAMRADPFDPLNDVIWTPPQWLHWPAAVLVLLGFLLVVPGILTPGPTLAGYEKIGLAKPEPARGILRITRHPFMWGVVLWAAAHVLVNGERFAPMLFGALGLMALYGARSIDRKGAARDPEGWARFAAVTSNVPFAAIFAGRNRFALGEIGWRALLAIVVFALTAYFHRYLFGVTALDWS